MSGDATITTPELAKMLGVKQVALRTMLCHCKGTDIGIVGPQQRGKGKPLAIDRRWATGFVAAVHAGLPFAMAARIAYRTTPTPDGGIHVAPEPEGTLSA